MKKVEARKLKGFQDYPHALMELRYRVMDEVRRAAREAGFGALQTPAIEYAEVLLGEGGETDKQVFKWDDNGGRSVALRYDLTVPFARYIAENGDLPMPLKRFQIGDVWRAEKPQKGRFREFCQCDFDIIGADSLAADAEVILAIYKVLTRLKVGGFTMTIGHRHILSGLLRKYLPGVFSHSGGEESCLIAIDKLDKIGSKKVSEALSQIPGAHHQGAVDLMDLLDRRSGNGSDLSAIRESLKDDEKALAALQRVENTISLINALTRSENSGSSYAELDKSTGTPDQESSVGKVIADFKIARGLAYYTGIVFETTLDALPSFGSISSGGRYDNLIERFVDRNLPGVGGSIGLDRLVAGLVELQPLKDSKRQGVYVIPACEGVEMWSFQVAESMRQLGLSVDVALKLGKLGKHFSHADKLQKKFAVVIGKDEFATQTLTVKNLETGDQLEKVVFSSAIDFIKSQVSSL